MSKHYIAFLGVTSLALLAGQNAFAAKSIDLSEQQPAVLRTLLPNKQFAAGPQSDLKQGKTAVDFNGVSHTRFQQVFAGVEVFGADGILHAPAKSADSHSASLRAFAANSHAAVTMEGVVYAELAKDLGAVPSAEQKAAAIAAAKRQYFSSSQDNRAITVRKVKPMVYLEKSERGDPIAHWAYEISLNVAPTKVNPGLTRPTFIIDAKTATVYEQGDEIHTLDEVYVGGVGGNAKMGQIAYGVTQKELPNAKSYLPKLAVTRFSDQRINFCIAENKETVVRDFRKDGEVIGDTIIGGEIVSFPCQVKDPYGLNLFWNALWAQQSDLANEGYSPTNDALYAGKVVSEMYKSWYGEPVLKNEDGSEMQLTMVVHYPEANAYWDGEKMIFGDGQYFDPRIDGYRNLFYPLTALDVGAHEVSHGYTNQHSNLYYAGQSGGINEAFSDMASQAAEFYSENKSSWQIGYKVTRDPVNNGGPLRYMDHPEKDGHSIANAKDYKIGLNVHYSSGVFNRLFYLIATDLERNKTGERKAIGWDTKKAFDIMVYANKHHWKRTSDFDDAACGVVKATRAYQKRFPGDYKMDTVMKAIAKVGVSNQHELEACLSRA